MNKKMKAIVPAVAVCAAATLGGVAYADSDDDESTESADSVTVTLLEKGDSGVTGTATYGDTVTARATGLDPDVEYYSFVYGNGSDAEGANPCILTGETLAGPGNTVGEWEVDEDGNGTLTADAPVDVEQAGALSIRADVTNTGGNVGPTPIDTLVACGDVGEEQDTTLGAVQDQVPQLPSTKPVTDAAGGELLPTVSGVND